MLKNNINLYYDTTHKFEIPYNFDLKLIEGLRLILSSMKEICHCIYLPPCYEHYHSIYRTKYLDQTFSNLNFEQYIYHINYINQFFPNKIQLLLQSPDELMPMHLLEQYLKLNIQKFCVGSIEQAKILKNINQNFEITCSVGMNLNKEKINQLIGQEQYIDYIVLPFYYTKHLNELKKLPHNFKYIIFCNSGCYNLCQGVHHWFKEKYNLQDLCPGTIDDLGWEASARIRPMDLFLFDKDVSIFKLVDRGFSTDMILREVVLYTTSYNLYTGIIYDEQKYNYNK